MSNWRKALIVGGCCIVVLSSYIVHKYRPFDGTYLIERFRFGSGHSIEIRGENEWEVYERLEARIAGAPRGSQLDADISYPMKFRLLLAEGGKLAAIVQDAKPNVVLMFHDLSNNVSWPRPEFFERQMDSQGDGEVLLKRLKAEYPNVILPSP